MSNPLQSSEVGGITIDKYKKPLQFAFMFLVI